MDDWFSEMERRMLAEMERMKRMMALGFDDEMPLLADEEWPDMTGSRPTVRSYGYRMVKVPGREPVIEQWGDVPEGFGPMLGTGGPGEAPEGAGEQAGEKDPMLDINETDSEVMVTMELPGFRKEGIELYLNGNSLVVKASSEERKAEKVIPLPAAVDGESIRATYRNGVLDVSMKKSTAGMKRIDIE